MIQIDGDVNMQSPHPALLPLVSILGILLLTVTMHFARGLGHLHGQLARTLLVQAREPN
jgi:xanthosine utilization system XapX-like protein